jgi:bacteriocin-like protein
MGRLKKEEANRGKKSIEMFESLSKNELNSVKGGDLQNTEKDDGDK